MGLRRTERRGETNTSRKFNTREMDGDQISKCVCPANLYEKEVRLCEKNMCRKVVSTEKSAGVLSVRCVSGGGKGR
jgi:hypothetical protein